MVMSKQLGASSWTGGRVGCVCRAVKREIIGELQITANGSQSVHAPSLNEYEIQLKVVLVL
jgi:hypothetical protein